jgi:hypothetical protein
MIRTNTYFHIYLHVIVKMIRLKHSTFTVLESSSIYYEKLEGNYGRFRKIRKSEY